MSIKALVTMPPYAPYMKEVAKHPIVEGLRLNTVMPVAEPLEDLLNRMNDTAMRYDRRLWIDLKCRQLRVKDYWAPPYTEIRISHNIKVDVPTTAYFDSGREEATVVRVDGDRLIMLDGPKRIIGPGESINIIDPSLSIEGYLTDNDKRYIEAGLRCNVPNFILSFVEKEEDIVEMRKYAVDASIISKIESQKGLAYVEHAYPGSSRLMAARGDLFVELKKPHHIIRALETIIAKDKEAIAASRIFGSLSQSLEPSCSDIGDVDNLLRMGYGTLMFGDDICFRRESILSGLNLLYAMAERYQDG